MTDRIRELANQVERIRDLYNIGPVHRDAVEQFAELIVKECIQVCNSRVGNSDYTTGRMHCVSDLKEHFGVE